MKSRFLNPLEDFHWYCRWSVRLKLWWAWSYSKIHHNFSNVRNVNLVVSGVHWKATHRRQKLSPGQFKPIPTYKMKNMKFSFRSQMFQRRWMRFQDFFRFFRISDYLVINDWNNMLFYFYTNKLQNMLWPWYN